MEDAVDYLKNPSNQDLKIAIMSQLEGKKAVYNNVTAKPKSKVKEEILEGKE